jgi:4-alpha-glucanotransferase
VHQPWGNFDYVFEDHLRDVYRPLVRSLMDGELWPVAMHISGPLLEWLDANAPDFVDEIGEHAAAGRLEILCAGHDEPILAVLSRQDRFEQVLHSRDWISRRFGVEARGLWLTERVWEPTLPGELAKAGVGFVLVDDRHFRVSGFGKEQLHSHYVTEAGGHRLNLFPIDEKLRYLIPFRPPAELAEYLRGLRSAGHQIAVLGDDGEKFGGWPGTQKWLYDDGWLAAFLGTMRQLRDNDEVRLSRFDDALTTTRSGGLAYLPSASYREMEGWSLPFEPARALLRLEQSWDGPRIQGVEGGLLRGGHWRHFLVKYPESNRMHKVAATLSDLCREQGDPADARRAISRAQCNDAYWHGVFGGLYLPFLRDTIWSNLAAAEAILRQGESLAVESRDIDVDGRDEIWAHSARVSILVAPARGGMIDVWLDLPQRGNRLNVVARHREAYHEALGAAHGENASHQDQHRDGGAPSIHDLETQLTTIPPIDTEPRGLFVDRVVTGSTARDDFVNGRTAPVRSWAGQPMDAAWQVAGGRAELTFRCHDLTKIVQIDDGAASISAEWRWNPDEHPADSWFSTELSFSTPLDIDAPGAERWDYAIETVSKSEKGFDHAVQGSAVVLRWPIAAGIARATVTAAG